MTVQKGFTLLELSIVLLIVTLMLGGLLVPLAKQTESRQRNEALEQVNEIRERLIGFALINGRLPCYTTQTDPANANYGLENSPCNPAVLTTDGILPWKTLGMENGLDPWGVQRSTAADPWLGYWRYRVHANFVAPITLTSSPFASDRLCVFDTSTTPNLVVSTSETPTALD